MANNTNNANQANQASGRGSSSGLRKRKSHNASADANTNNDNGNMHSIEAPQLNQQGWMHYPPPPQAAYPPPPNQYNPYGMSWGMQPYYPLMGIGYNPQQPYPYQQPQYQSNCYNAGNGNGNSNGNGNGNMPIGWMPQPHMHQPMMILPPPPLAGFNPRGFAPSHNGNIQDLVQINEIDELEEQEELKEQNEIVELAARDKSNAGGVATKPDTKKQTEKSNSKSQKQEAIPVEAKNQEPRHKPAQNSERKNKEPKEQNNKKEIKDANQLAHIFDNVLDNMQAIANPKKTYNQEFGQESDDSNVLFGLEPVNPQQAHFDCDRYPNELYNVKMYLGNISKLPAKDIAPDSLETAKTVYYHNKQLAAQLNGKPSAGKAFIYVRSSRANDISIETQRKACLQYALDKGLELLPFGYQSDNNISARNMNNLNHELGFWKDELPDNSHIIIYSVDRLSRHLVQGMQFLDEMTQYGIHIHFTTHELVFHAGISAAGRAMIQQELQSAEKFSNIASEKVRTTMARLRQEGHVFGRAPYGFKHMKIDNIRKRIPDNKEMQNIRQIQSQYIYIMNNWKNNPDTADQAYTKMNMLCALSRWCIRTGLKHRNQKNYTKTQLKSILQINTNNVN